MTNRIEYFSTKKAAIDRLKATGWQKVEDQYRGDWFKFPIHGGASKNAHVGRASKTHRGLWAINYND